MTTTAQDHDRAGRARGALLGLAVGDALGLPALYHRTVRMDFHRGALWRFAQDLDVQRVLRFPLPFTLGRPEPLELCGTDDAEYAAVAARILLESGDGDPEALLAGWRSHVVDAADELWCGIAERSSILNLQQGVLPPASGSDNPAHFDDGAVTRAVPFGLRWAGDPAEAATRARAFAQITHAEDGVWAAAAMAASIAAAVAGADPQQVVEIGRQQIPGDSWLGRQVVHALGLAAEAESAFDLAAALADEVANASYSFGTVAPETLPAAYALTLAADGDPERAVPAAGTVAKQSDSMPAMVGALCGALRGERSLPGQWRRKVQVLRGICVPGLTGTDLVDLADRLLAARDAARPGNGAPLPDTLEPARPR